jgi:cyanophycinase
MMKRIFLIITLLSSFCLFIQSASAQTTGPMRGSLVIVGGGMRDFNILHRFAELAGGHDAPIVVIPTASGAEDYDQYWGGLEQFKQAGFTDIKLIHTYDPEIADTDEFAAPIRNAQGVWFTGGRQWRLADSYLDTKVNDALTELLERDGVIGGSSAGATILGSYLARGDSGGNTIMMGDHEEGFGFIKNIAIDQHLLRRNRQFDLLEIIEAKPELLGIGLDEDTAIVVQGNLFEVIGKSYAVIYDSEHILDSGGQFYFLEPGDEFNLLSRQAYRPQEILRPFDRVIESN